MKRRAEDMVKGDVGGNVGYPPPGSLSPSRHPPPRAIPTVQPYLPQAVKSSVPDLNLGQQYQVPNFATGPMANVNPAMKSNGGGGVNTAGPSGAGPSMQGAGPIPSGSHGMHPSNRHKMHGGSTTPPSVGGGSSALQQQQFQRLKVEDALSYLDNVKMKFNNHPQVYNDFLDIMKEFKSQSIDTPGVIERVSKLFQGHPDLILGFNTFLPPGYKIEVSTNDSGFRVQVSMPSPATSTTTTIVPPVPAHSAPVHQPPVAPLALTTNSPASPATVVVSSSNKPLIIGSSNVVAPNPVVAAVPQQSPSAAISQALSHYSTHLNAAAAAAAAVTDCPPAPSHPEHQPTQPINQNQGQSQSQPVEFNHAINYVNKIKNRFQDQPEIYKKFLEILNTYQKDQKNYKDAGKQLTEAEVYAQVAKLFQNQDDLLAEFGQFLPDATNHQATSSKVMSADHPPPPRSAKPLGLKMSAPFPSTSSTPSPSSAGPSGPKFSAQSSSHANSAPGPSGLSNQGPAPMKRSPSSFAGPSGLQQMHHQSQPKKQKLSAVSSSREVPASDAGKYGALSDYAFFDKVHKSLRNIDIYENFLRCLVLFNENMISRAELLSLVSPFLCRSPDLLQWFKCFIGETGSTSNPSQSGNDYSLDSHNSMMSSVNRQDRPPGEFAMEIDFSTCKRLGASYCAVPKDYVHPKCSGRSQLCREVLNDSWVSFPSWSEESTFVTSRKTQFEEYIYRCEDERFELDVVLETNLAAIRVLETLQKKINRMSPDEISKLKFDSSMGGTSPTLMDRAVRRLYGDKATDIMEGLRLQPLTCIPMVLKRLKQKDEEWRDAQKGFNKVWKEQNEKFYLKSLDHQGINFKQNDLKALRSKSLFNEIETLCDERHDQAEEACEQTQIGPHMSFIYKDKGVLDDAANLLIHHVKRQTSINKEDKQRIKQLLRQIIPDFFYHPRQELSEDEREDTNDKMDEDAADSDKEEDGPGKEDGAKEPEDIKPPLHALSTFHDESYTLFFGTNKWYLFMRLHQILCERLTKISEKAAILAQEESIESELRTPSAAMALRLKPRSNYLKGVTVDGYYTAFLEMVKNVLDGNMDNNAYEDTLREMFGIHAFVAFTLDKVVSYAVRQLQHLVMEESCIECTDLYLKEARRGGAGGTCASAQARANYEIAYQRKAEAILNDENCFKIVLYKLECKLTIELLDSEGEREGRQARASQNCEYEESQNRNQNGSDGDDRTSGKAVFLARNVRLTTNKSPNESDEAQPPKRSTDDDNECTFNLNNYRVVYAVDRDSFLYRRYAILRAKQTHPSLSQRLGEKFRRWHERWLNEHVDQSQINHSTEWLMGRAPDHVPNFTQVLSNNSLTKAPYRLFNRYQVKRL
ncbi:paired amphipathic helix protein Sin3b isoform X2 [Nilaparvata lugens]|uniref:paired amphipathic helix protein Sin3b isoform X2 n=1 Tax=Nilaparvata lugens TaxID=108931 RepID=UPI00193E321F|nr:paired amphipathic helix protein Sin3b isoform X2 [Nilaparvata lugens]